MTETEPQPTEQPELAQSPPAPEPAPEPAPQASEDLSAWRNEITQLVMDGGFEGDNLSKIDEVARRVGLTVQDIQLYAQGAFANQQQAEQQVLEAVGGQERVNAAIEWARNNWSQEQIQAFDAAAQSGDLAQQELALHRLTSAYSTATGGGGAATPVYGKPASGSGVEPFGSSYDVTTAMSDQRYQLDPAYRAQVMARLAVTPNEVMGYGGSR